jgi:hypothetical protein
MNGAMGGAGFGLSRQLFAVALLTACTPVRILPPAPPPTPVIVPELPAVPVETIVGDSVAKPVEAPGTRITLTSSNANLRELLPLLASAAGVDLVMGPEVRGRVSVRFQNVRAIDALRAVIEQAELVVGTAGPDLPWGTPVFYDLPVNINFASARTIRARFDLTQALSDWIVKARTF